MKDNAKASSIGTKRRSLIISSALKVFAEDGFKGASIQKIADAAKLPKANVLYYFSSKKALYCKVIESILAMWNSSFDNVTANDCPAESLANYIADKMEISRLHPYSSKVFAIEIINGGSNLDDSFKASHQNWVSGRISVINAWIEAGKLDDIHPEYLLFNIWSSTQHYADFSSQISQLRGSVMRKKDFAQATTTVINIILKGCGLKVPSAYTIPKNK